MRIPCLCLFLFLACFKSNAQIPAFINYQAVARYTNSNIPLPHRPVSVNFRIRQGGVLGRIVFEETQVDTTDDCGLFNMKIGSIQAAAFKQIDWSTGSKFLEVNVNGAVTGISELSNTPYAFYADYSKSSLDWKNIGDTVLYSAGKRIGIGTTNPTTALQVNGILRVAGDATSSVKMDIAAHAPDDNNWITSSDESGNLLWILNMADRNLGNRFGLFSQKARAYVFNATTDGNIGIKTDASASYALSVNGEMNVNGGGSVNCLTIKGGCDWYEEAKAVETIEPGQVVTIDAGGSMNTVKRSTVAYDRLVTGVVSGAGGINPGIGLQQAGMLEGNTKIAMGGKVKVYVTGRVAPGDLLTSSARPGYAMAVKNRRKAFGAVLGKALSLPDKDGLVLMQVMMQ